MDSVKININAPTNGMVKLNIATITEKNGELNIKLSDNACYSINPGDKLYFRRIVRCKNSDVVYEEFVIVKEEDSDHVLHTTLLENRKTFLEDNFFNVKYNENELYHIIWCSEPHYLYGQDIEESGNQAIYFKKLDGSIVGTCSGIRPLNIYRKDEFIKDDCFVYSDFEETCGKEYGRVETKHYHFLPDGESRFGFILTDFNEFEIPNADYIETKFNPFYYYTMKMGIPKGQDEEHWQQEEQRGKQQATIEASLVPIEFDDYGKPIKHCHLYGDVWFDSLNDSDNVKYVNDYYNSVNVIADEEYYSVTLGLSGDMNESTLGNEDYFSEQFSENIEETLIPEFIDMERVKYVPYGRRYTGHPLTSITIYPHFRQRAIIDEENNTNTQSTSGNMYYDGWYVDSDNYNAYWNGYYGNGSVESINEFVDASGKTSDLIGFLNFTDNDIYYRKNKVSKSFFRFSFYNSTDPIEQKLLYYSTVFIDSGELLSKFLKQSAFIQDSLGENVIINDINLDEDGNCKNENVKVVFCENKNVGARIDSTIAITNEYERSRSSEGFNLYLFADDVPEGNEGKTIYMKIEFNHAGNGKTIPMIVLPTTEKLTTKNFFEYLYIPIKIEKYNGKYVYRIMKAYDHSNGNADLCLFEAKLEYEDD